LSWFLAFAGFALLVILHELGHFTAAKAVGMRVERFSLFFPPTIAKKKVGETEYAIGALPLGGYVKISGMNPDEKLPDDVRDRAYHAQPVWKRIVVIAAGPAVNFVLAFVLLLLFYGAIGPHEPTRQVGDIAKDYPAQGVLQSGDKIVAVDGKGGSLEQLRERIDSHKCAERPLKPKCKAATPAQITVLRDGRRRTFELRPIYDPTTKTMRVGFGYKPGPRDPLPLGKSVDVSAQHFWFITKETLKLPARIIDPQQRKEISGVVGAYESTRQTILEDAADAILILAVISLSLAIINLFPFLPLDGGHIFWAIVEKIRRRPVPLVVMERSGVLGMLLVIGIFLIGFSNDLGRLTGGQGFTPR